MHSFEDFDISADDSTCDNSFVAIGPSPCAILCGMHYPLSYMSNHPDVWIRYVYRETAGPLRRGFKLIFVVGECSADFSHLSLFRLIVLHILFFEMILHDRFCIWCWLVIFHFLLEFLY